LQKLNQKESLEAAMAYRPQPSMKSSHACAAGTTKDENVFGMGVLSLTCIAL